MNAQRIVALLMIALQVAVAENMLFGIEWFPLAIGVMALIGTPGFIQFRLGYMGKAIALITLWCAIYFGTNNGLLFVNRLPMLPLMWGIAYPMGWFLLVLQAGVLYLRTKDGRLPAYFPVLGAAVFAYLGLTGRHGSLNPVYHATALLFVACCVVFWTLGKSTVRLRTNVPRLRAIGFRSILLLLLLLASFISSTIIGTYRNEIDAAFVNLVTPAASAVSVGFSEESRLGNVNLLKDRSGDKVALRVSMDNNAPLSDLPLYLHGRVYDSYREEQWETDAPAAILAPAAIDRSALPLSKPRGEVYRLRPGDAPFARGTVHPSASYGGNVFMPLGTTLVGVDGATLSGDAYGNARMLEGGAREYDVLVSAPRQETLSPEARDRLTAVPDTLEAGVRALAETLFADCPTTQEKMAKLVRYFRQEYRYGKQVTVPDGREPLSYFLLERPPAHCEYFASGAAILLRLSGVPTRYANGFVVGEHNRIGGYWMARNRDAHAWVEVYDDTSETWQTLEATVAQGVPGQEEEPSASYVAQLRDAVVFGVQRLWAALTMRDWHALLAMAPWPAGLFALALLGWLLRSVPRRTPRERKRPRRRALRPEQKRLLALRKQVDRKLKRLGFVRNPTETVHAFAQRIAASAARQQDPERASRLEQAAAWYEQYNAARFLGTTPEAVTAL